MNVKKIIKEEVHRFILSESSDINKILYFSYNYPADFIYKIWADDMNLAKHLQQKFTALYKKYGPRGVFVAFYMQLDKENQSKLEHWIISNYDN